MHCTQIGAITLEMDSQLTSLLKSVDASGVDVTSVKSLVAYAEQLHAHARQAHAQGNLTLAHSYLERARQLEAIATEMLKVPGVQELLRAPVGALTLSSQLLAPTTSFTTKTLSFAPTTTLVASPTPTATTTVTKSTLLTATPTTSTSTPPPTKTLSPTVAVQTTTPTKTLSPVPTVAIRPAPTPSNPLTVVVPPVPPPVIHEDEPLPGPTLKASDVDEGLGTIGKVVIAGGIGFLLWKLLGKKKSA